MGKISGDGSSAPSSGATKGGPTGTTTAFPSPAGGGDEVREGAGSRACALDLISAAF